MQSRLARYAAFTLLHLVVVLAALALGGHQTGLIVLVVSIPLLFAWGHFQAHVAMNPELDEAGRRRWRVLLYVVPWSMSLYWYRYVRPAA